MNVIHFSFIAVVLLSTAMYSKAEQLVIDAQANIFGAGHATPPSPGGHGGGLMPPVFSFTASSEQVLTFFNVSGTVSWQPGYTTGPEGSIGSVATDIPSYGGISGIIDGNRVFFLVGVFLNDTEPVDPATSRLNFTNINDFLSISPALNQVFFVGDGLTGTGNGNMQQFYVPDIATRLFLGFADAQGFSEGPPGWYEDNSGNLTAIFNIGPVSEPATFVMLGMGALSLLFVLLRRKFSQA